MSVDECRHLGSWSLLLFAVICLYLVKVEKKGVLGQPPILQKWLKPDQFWSFLVTQNHEKVLILYTFSTGPLEIHGTPFFSKRDSGKCSKSMILLRARQKSG